MGSPEVCAHQDVPFKVRVLTANVEELLAIELVDVDHVVLKTREFD